MGDTIKLVGILVVVLGFALRWHPLLVVMAAGTITGLVAGLSFYDVLSAFGRFFVENRFMTMPVFLMLPLIGLLEWHGLQERAALLIRRVRVTTAGHILLAYHALRAGASTVGLNIGGHVSMVRPLIVPMAEGAARTRGGGLSPQGSAAIRAHAAASENLGNFFADDILVAIGPVLLIKAFFDSVQVPVNIFAIALWGTPTAFWVLLVGWWRYRAMDRKLAALSAPRS